MLLTLSKNTRKYFGMGEHPLHEYVVYSYSNNGLFSSTFPVTPLIILFDSSLQCVISNGRTHSGISCDGVTTMTRLNALRPFTGRNRVAHAVRLQLALHEHSPVTMDLKTLSLAVPQYMVRRDLSVQACPHDWTAFVLPGGGTLGSVA